MNVVAWIKDPANLVGLGLLVASAALLVLSIAHF